MSIWKGSTARNGPIVLQASMKVPVLRVCMSILCVASSHLLVCTMRAIPADVNRESKASVANSGEHVRSPDIVLAPGAFEEPSGSTAQANVSTGGTLAAPPADASRERSVKDSQGTDKSSTQSDSHAGGEHVPTVQPRGVRDTAGLAAGNTFPGQRPSVFDRPSSLLHGYAEDADGEGIARGSAGQLRVSKILRSAANGIGVLPDFEPSSACGELEVQEAHEVGSEPRKAAFPEGHPRFNTFNDYALSLTDKFAEKIATLTAQVDLLRMDVVRARDEVHRLNDAFDARTDETLQKIEERSTHFGADLLRLERQLEGQLNPRTGVASKRIGELRQELLNLRVRARDMFEKEATVYVQQIESCSARVDSLTEIYFDLKSRTDLEVNEIESYMVTARLKLEDTMREQLNILAETEREAAARASQRFKSFLKSLRLEGNVLQSVVEKIQRRFLGPRSSFADSGESSTRGATYIDMSGLFANSKVDKVCVVVTQLVKELLHGNVVVPIFVHSVRRIRPRTSLAGEPGCLAARPAKRSFGKSSLFSRTFTARMPVLDKRPKFQNHRQCVRNKSRNAKQGVTGGTNRTIFDASPDPAVEVVLPNVEILEKAAALWLEERQEYGLSYDHYAVIRIEGYLMEYFTVPFLEYRPFLYASEDKFITVNVEQFAATLKRSVEEKLASLETGLQKQTYLLVAYLGEVAVDDDNVRPRPSLLQTGSRISLARQLTQNVKPRSPSMYFIFQYFQQMLHFTDHAEQLFKQGVRKRQALQARLAGDDIRVLVLTEDCRAGTGDCSAWGVMTPRSRNADPFFRGAFGVLRLTLKQLAPNFLVFPSDYLLAAALDQLVWEITGGCRLPGPLSLLYMPPNSSKRGSDTHTETTNQEVPQRRRSERRLSSGVLITTGGKAARSWSTATLTASLSLLEHRRRRVHGTPADSLGIMKKDVASDEVIVINVLKDSTQHAVRVSFSDTLEEVAKHTLSVTLRVMRERLDHLSRGYTLYVYVNLT